MLICVKKWLYNQKIYKKFTIPVVMVMCILIAVILLISNVLLYWSALRKTEKEIKTSCDIIALQLEDVVADAKTCLKTMVKDINQIYQGENVLEMTDMKSAEITNNVYTDMNYYRICFPDIMALIYVDESGRVIASGQGNCIKNLAYEDLLPLIRKIPQKGIPDVKELGMQVFSSVLDGLPILVLGHRTISISTGKIMGYAFAMIRSDTLSKYFPGEKDMGYYSVYQLWNEKNTIIAARDRNMLMKPGGNQEFLDSFKSDASFRIRENRISYLVTTCSLWHENWTLVNRVKIYELTREIYLMFTVIMISGLFCIFLSVFIIRRIAAWITLPLENLTKTVSQFHDESLDIRCTVDSTDEIGLLADVFNDMMERIRQEIENIQQVQRQKRYYELALIQAQIKPHFLYNTLDLIYIFCQMGNVQGGARVTKALADYYRMSLSNGKEIVLIADEVKNISNYLLIQRERYSDLISFSVEVDQDILLYEIPKLTLQPLVENAIYHGLKSCGKKGTIWVRGYQENGLVCLEVEDTGKGMAKDVWMSILQNEEKENSPHFGLLSVHKRIKLYYGEEYGIELRSIPDKGTCVLIRIPARKEDYNYAKAVDCR